MNRVKKSTVAQNDTDQTSQSDIDIEIAVDDSKNNLTNGEINIYKLCTF